MDSQNAVQRLPTIPMYETLAIETTQLSKVFGNVTAVDGLNLAVKKGELYGLVGPDGGGKTTTIRMLASIMTPTSGNASVAGHDVSSEGEAIKEKIGYMSQRFGLYEDLSVVENILFYADLYSVPKQERKSRIDRLLGFSNLTPFQSRLAGKLSGGMKQKLGLACALVHTPEILFLDEPTNGVDPVSRRDFWRILYDLLRNKVTIFISTSYLDEAERCTRVGLMHQGKIIIEDDPVRVKQSLGQPMIEIWIDRVREAGEQAMTIESVNTVGMYGDRLHIAMNRKDAAGEIVGELQRRGFAVQNYREIVPNLEDVFISMVSK